jgi:hypothetical protein
MAGMGAREVISVARGERHTVKRFVSNSARLVIVVPDPFDLPTRTYRFRRPIPQPLWSIIGKTRVHRDAEPRSGEARRLIQPHIVETDRILQSAEPLKIWLPVRSRAVLAPCSASVIECSASSFVG